MFGVNFILRLGVYFLCNMLFEDDGNCGNIYFYFWFLESEGKFFLLIMGLKCYFFYMIDLLEDGCLFIISCGFR